MKRPNFIIIYCDDLGYGDLGCYGSDVIQTPHLDQLASEGVRFTDWYSNSPVCSPSRASLLTGKYPAKTGVCEILGGKRGTSGLPDDQTTLAKALRSSGYRTALFGKWHLGVSADNNPNTHGFDEFFGFLAGCVDYYSHIFYWGQGDGINPVHDLWHNDQEVWLNGSYLTDVITDKAVQFIGQQEEQPFFMYVPYNAPHYPMHAPAKYVDRYPGLPPDRRIMAAMISAVDDGVGAIMEQLKKTGHAESTVIFFSSDNGPSTESRNFLDGTEDLYYGGSAGIFRGHKASLFEGGIREPAILSFPAYVSGGQVKSEPFAMIDIFPTFLKLAGVVPDSGCSSLDGFDVMPVLRGEAEMRERQIFWEYNGQSAIREGNWKLVLDGKLDISRTAAEPVHLSDLSVDPSEQINLMHQYPDVVSRLRHDLHKWLVEIRGKIDVM
ncbi:sulfatase-like hydrolase/transferase [Cohnella silvisoli]|uniref:Sulfatase-like hydrolase/transferase n=1 Tax=Cohnella silvisoli TaxID=2873699 RepID=A0ABV1L5E1_9BACL|nr:sulfatase-like hydrolase/transferase [Cohnella silvisoli]MCD9026184.1 sulfatase-like hydrolase/transferase [Cohnella silvisoli]